MPRVYAEFQQQSQESQQAQTPTTIQMPPSAAVTNPFAISQTRNVS